MPFARIVAGWIAVVAIYLAWREVEYRRKTRSQGALSRSALYPLLVEAGLFVLFAALWFGSLGSGGGYILFPLLGLLIVLPEQLRRKASGLPVAWPAAIATILFRITLPGILLGFVLA